MISSTVYGGQGNDIFTLTSRGGVVYGDAGAEASPVLPPRLRFTATLTVIQVTTPSLTLVSPPAQLFTVVVD